MLDGEGRSFLREVEHVEDDRFVAGVHAAVDRADHFDDDLAGADNLPLAVEPGYRKLALLQDAVVDYRMVMPRKFASDREYVSHHDEFGLSLEVIWQFGAVPALGRAFQFEFLDCCDIVVLRERRNFTVAFAAGSASRRGGENGNHWQEYMDFVRHRQVLILP